MDVIYTSAESDSKNAIAFDLDETIGAFSYFYSIWARLETGAKNQQVFSDLLDLYPEFLRVGILSVLKYIRTRQEDGLCLPIYIYTNNQCEDYGWIYMLIDYLESRVIPGKTVKIFARPICAFKINGKVVEPGRTTHEKTYSDFVRCSMLSTSHEICFIDDAYHKKMKHRKVYYIQPPPYVHSLTYNQTIDRFIASDIYARLYPHRKKGTQFIGAKTIDQLNTSEEQRITNKIMYHIREFFLVSSRKRATKRRRVYIGNFSRKRRRT